MAATKMLASFLNMLPTLRCLVLRQSAQPWARALCSHRLLSTSAACSFPRWNLPTGDAKPARPATKPARPKTRAPSGAATKKANAAGPKSGGAKTWAKPTPQKPAPKRPDSKARSKRTDTRPASKRPETKNPQKRVEKRTEPRLALKRAETKPPPTKIEKRTETRPALKTAQTAQKPAAKTRTGTEPKPTTRQPIESFQRPEPALSYLPCPSNDPNQHTIQALPPSPASINAATAVFTGQPSRFLFAAPRFLNIPMNTYVPEVCLLGRSNVGKSTLLNGLAGAEGAIAGRSHGLAARRAGLAITSSRAGSTKTMNGFGFGPPVRVAPQPDGGAKAGKKSKFGISRSQRREAAKQTEKPPGHSLVLLDMPGYGLNSEAEWGVQIAKYLSRRAMLRGAVVLIDALTGIKDGDRQALSLLRDAGVRTTVVLTKADKLAPAIEDRQKAIDAMCMAVWDELRAIEKESLSWVEGAENGWESEIWVTGAGDPKSGGFGVAATRLAICRLAGLVEDKRVAPKPIGTSKVAASAAESEVATAPGETSPALGDTVPFDQITWKTATTPQVTPKEDEKLF
ncbi:hypothetical protein B0T26DRAFT_736201 [Lasiosphaeria miniovina]|uniref:EngB-type G domain-containing protein n=1 Tax=Lasiosphaeria miniovina TaxID=1954250 RepID=A0AA40BFH9_9PEZI|nr:uncharacterized protein B0T26DRAFT_736201 [Lasiosphaeria miniovina]KAK0733241.1 hypothetical protein B0T26DRAFT_736201 [Lasiosphaeria miniovina]